VSIFTPADIVAFRELKAELAYADPYDLLRPVSGGEDYAGATITSDEYAVVEVGMGRLKRTQADSREAATALGLGWTSAYTFETAYASIAEPQDRLRIGNRTFEIAVPQREERLGIETTLVVREVG
jgi:hypothetical protein